MSPEERRTALYPFTIWISRTNEIDNNVGTYKYENQLIPEIAYVSDSRMIAVSDQNIMVFDGSQKPKLKQTIKLES